MANEHPSRGVKRPRTSKKRAPPPSDDEHAVEEQNISEEGGPGPSLQDVDLVEEGSTAKERGPDPSDDESLIEEQNTGRPEPSDDEDVVVDMETSSAASKKPRLSFLPSIPAATVKARVATISGWVLQHLAHRMGPTVPTRSLKLYARLAGDLLPLAGPEWAEEAAEPDNGEFTHDSLTPALLDVRTQLVLLADTLATDAEAMGTAVQLLTMALCSLELVRRESLKSLLANQAGRYESEDDEEFAKVVRESLKAESSGLEKTYETVVLALRKACVLRFLAASWAAFCKTSPGADEEAQSPSEFPAMHALALLNIVFPPTLPPKWHGAPITIKQHHIPTVKLFHTSQQAHAMRLELFEVIDALDAAAEASQAETAEVIIVHDDGASSTAAADNATSLKPVHQTMLTNAPRDWNEAREKAWKYISTAQEFRERMSDMSPPSASESEAQKNGNRRESDVRHVEVDGTTTLEKILQQAQLEDDEHQMEAEPRPPQFEESEAEDYGYEKSRATESTNEA
ncbi:uncharacterized protein EV422DRAFT_568525 [Fimicolochytrium jonesii]|uniref:uncharacterized protein n=1 Tax=Fimicolochytrium jonesii TaxID=1396493 RepID=UPI0022FE336B|nr:uncharacterized protein EV422DRAFT_568525 [Fimicolochytrium jonesii]KAI8819555.1 hypothetical protein EV422DRAFT_568525 [Fimicolochytrium jonesii]